MKKKIFSVGAALAAFIAVAEPSVTSVSIRQLWPWTNEVEVSYKLSDYEKGVNLTVEAYDGDTRIADFRTLEPAIVGRFRNIREESGSFRIDMSKVDFSVKAFAGFNVRLSAVQDDVLYRVYDLLSGSYDDVTRGELLNGDYGTVETDFAKVGRNFGVDGFNTSLDDVVIWTGVTNDVAYKTTKLVMRKILAKNKSFMMGCRPDDCLLKENGATAPLHEVSFTNDYFISVFELTEGQALSVITNKTVVDAGGNLSSSSYKMRFTNEMYRYQRPINATDVFVRYQAAKWPFEPKKGAFQNNAGSFIGNLRMLTGEIGFDLPTESFWEYACRAGTDSAFNSGINNSSDAHMKAIARSVLNSNCDHKNYNPTNHVQALWTPDEGASAIVGSYAPNAWGLYDMHGNMMEWCLDHYYEDPTGYEGYTSVDPWGPQYDDTGVSYEVAKENKGRLNHVGRGGAFWYAARYNASSARMSYYTNNSNTSYGGVRICITVFD